MEGVNTHIFHFEGQAIEAYLINGELRELWVCGEDIELKLTPDLVEAFKKSYWL